MCLFRLELEKLELFSKSMEIFSSRISLLCAILYPCASMHYLDYIILGMASSTPIRSPSMKLSQFIFCFVEKLDTDTFNRYITELVYPRQYSCTVYEAYNHKFTTETSSTFRVSFSSLVPVRYLKTHFRFTSRTCLYYSRAWRGMLL